VAINFKIADERTIDRDDDPMDRDSVGYRQTMTDGEVFEKNRGMWFLGLRAQDEGYATFSYMGKIVVVAEIAGVETLPWKRPKGRRDKQAVIGRALGPGHPAYEFFIDRRVDNTSRNPVAYLEDPSPRRSSEPRPCACGCGTSIAPPRHFAPGHDQRAVHERIAQQWGDTIGFIRWFDDSYDRKAD